MQSNRVTTLRVLVIVILVLLAFQYELGMIVNIANPAAIPPVPNTNAALQQALSGVGPVALVHASLGFVLLILALVALVYSIISRVRAAQVFGALAFLAVLFAANGGYNFVRSGFQNDNNSHAMASMFLAAFALYFIELYVLKPPAKASP